VGVAKFFTLIFLRNLSHDKHVMFALINIFLKLAVILALCVAMSKQTLSLSLNLTIITLVNFKFINLNLVKF